MVTVRSLRSFIDDSAIREGFDLSINLEPLRVYPSPLATHITYRVLR
jgi:hypothetical protein